MTKAELYQKACMLPLLPGVYIIRDKSDTIIYIGKAKRLRIRVSQYFREGVPHDNKVSQMIAHAYAFDVIVCQSEFEALVLEASQIKAHTPKYNILLKDDKGYSYIRVTREDWPRLSFTLQKEEDGAEYIGPYTSSFAARQMAETAMDAFLLPRCSKRFPQEIGKGRPCLNAHIGKCMAVCSGKISCETYNQAVKNAVHLIRYGKKDILKTLNERIRLEEQISNNGIDGFHHHCLFLRFFAIYHRIRILLFYLSCQRQATDRYYDNCYRFLIHRFLILLL